MIVTAFTMLLIWLLAVLLVVAGHYIKNPALYSAGALLFILMAWPLFVEGFAEQTGETITSNQTGNTSIGVDTEQTVNFVYDTNSGNVTNILGIFSILTGTALFLFLYWEVSEQKRRKRNSLSMEDLD